MNFNGIEQAVREELNTPLHLPKRPVLVEYARGLFFALLLLCLPIYLLSKSSVSPWVLITAGCLLAIAFLVYDFFKSRRSSAGMALSAPVTTLYRDFVASIIALIALLYFAVMQAINLSTHHSLGWNDRFSLVLLPVMMVVLVKIIIDIYKTYRQLKSSKV